MISAKLYTKKNTYRHCCKQELQRNLPFLIVFSVACFLLLLFPNILMLIKEFQNKTLMMQEVAYQPSYSFGLNPASVVFFPFLGFILSLLQFSFLSNKRAMDVYASLPILRERAVSAKIMTGLGILIIPTLLCEFLLYIVNVLVIGGTKYLGYELLFVMFTSLVLLLLPYAIGVFVSTLSGTITENIIHPLVFMFCPILIYISLIGVFDALLYGYYLSFDVSGIVSYIFPYAVAAADNIADLLGGIANIFLWSDTYNLSPTDSFFTIIKGIFPQMALWGAITVVLLCLSVRFYKKRKCETAGKKNASVILSSISCFLISTLAGLVFLVVGAAFTENSPASFLQYIFFICGSALAFFIAQLILEQSISAAGKACRQYLFYLPIYAVFLVFVATNGFGGYNRIPKVENVSEVSINYSGVEGYLTNPSNISGYNVSRIAYGEELRNSTFTTTDPEIIRVITEFQRNAIQTRRQEYSPRPYLNFTYTMKSTARMQRSYKYVSNESQEILTKLMEFDEFKQETHFSYTIDFKQYKINYISDLFGSHKNETDAEKLDTELLQSAIQKDVLNETLEDIYNPKAPALGTICMQLHTDDENYSRSNNYLPSSLFISVKAHYTNTIAYLEEMGLLDDLQPNYENISQIALIPIDSNDEREFFIQTMSFGKLALFGLSFVEEPVSYHAEDLGNALQGDQIPANIYKDKDKIKAVLSKAYNQHAYSETSTVVLVQTGEYVAKLLLP